MRRTKEWWARLEPEERSTLVYLERADHHCGYSSYYPDDCVECAGCGCPSMGGLCNMCNSMLIEILDKANAVGEKLECQAS